MAEAVVRATFVATDHVTPVVKGMRSEITKLGSKTGGPLGGLLGGIGGLNLGMVGLGIGVVGAVGALGDFAKKAIDDAASVDHLTTSLKDNIPAWNGNMDAIDAYIQSGEKLAFSVDDQRNALALMVTRTHDVAKAMTLVSEAEDLARLKGISLADASAIVGKVFSGQISAARRAGVAIDKNATSTQALAQIQKAAAGQADAYAHTQAGTLASISIQFDEMEKTIGRGVLGVIDDLGTAFNNLQRAMNPTLGVTQDMEAAIRKEAAAMGVNAEAAVAFYEAQTNATAAAAANAQALQDQAIAAEMAAHPSETLFTIQQKLGVAMADVIRVANGQSTAIQQTADYTQSADGVLNQYAKSLRDAGQAAADQKSHYDDLNSTVKAFIPTLHHVSSSSQSMAALTIQSFDLMTGGISGALKSADKDAKSEVNKLWYDIRHPGELAKNRDALKHQMERAQKALHAAEKTGDANVIAEAQALVDKLNTTWAGLNATITVNARIDSYNQSRHPLLGGGRAGGGYVGRGDTVLVGENGPEVLHMGSAGGQVTQGRGGMNGGQGHTTLVYLNGDLIAKQVDDYLGRRWGNSGFGSRN